MSCEKAMTRIKREVDDFLEGSPAASVASAAPAATRGRSSSRAASKGEKRALTAAQQAHANSVRAFMLEKQQTLPKGSKYTAANAAKNMLKERLAKLSPTARAAAEEKLEKVRASRAKSAAKKKAEKALSGGRRRTRGRRASRKSRRASRKSRRAHRSRRH
jgi:hypothetical protein